MMRNQFEKQLETLHVELITMGALCEEAISTVTKALLDDDLALLDKVHAIEENIDQKERDIEALCMKLLLQQQPVARDLRTISSALKMISDMERIGDQAADIADIVKQLHGSALINHVHLKSMAHATIKMVTDSVDAFVKKDLPLAKDVMLQDDTVDTLFIEIKQELMQLLTEHPQNSGYCLDLLMIAKYLERIGDHAVNVAEWVEYSLTGTHKGDTL